MLAPFPAHAWPGRVVTVMDGDTVAVEPIDGGMPVTIRLHGIDAPENKQPGGAAARGFMFDIALYQLVEVEPMGKPDRYKRTVAVVYLPGGVSLQALLLEAGLVWIWPRYCQNCEEWEALQKEARTAGRGLWASTEVMPPWEWRRK